MVELLYNAVGFVLIDCALFYEVPESAHLCYFSIPIMWPKLSACGSKEGLRGGHHTTALH